jgi:hypothetical protein
MIYLPIYFQAGLGYDNVTAGLSLLAYTLPTLVVPPLAERLALRYRPGLVIPMGLFTIGLGFILMTIGSAIAQASWLTMLPGCALAGVGLGLTNTPVTNTTTGSVPRERAGMASGIDMSARMVSLAVNIALMGFILAATIESALRHGSHALTDNASLREVAEKMATGACPALPFTDSIGPAAASAYCSAALSQGFGMVMLYAAASAWIFAAASLLAFGRTKAAASSAVPG